MNTKADMQQIREPLTSCSLCGEDLFDGDKAFATTTGSMDADVGGFAADENNWLDVVCSECGDTIGDAICKIEVKPKAVKPEDFYGWPERCRKVMADLEGTNSAVIFKNVMVLLQDADEMGGVANELEYMKLMQAVIDECKVRLETCKGTLADVYGANVLDKAGNGENPCDGCNDINLDGRRCVNESRCKAWEIYENACRNELIRLEGTRS